MPSPDQRRRCVRDANACSLAVPEDRHQRRSRQWLRATGLAFVTPARMAPGRRPDRPRPPRRRRAAVAAGSAGLPPASPWLTWIEVFIAATTEPSRRARARRWSADRPRAPGRRVRSPGERPCRRRVASFLASVTVDGVKLANVLVAEVVVDPGLRLGGQHHPTHGRGVGREPGPHVDRHGHDALGGYAGDVDDIVAVEHGHRARLVDPGDERLHVRKCDLGQRQAGQVGVAELQHPGPQREQPAIGAHVTEVDERVQEPPRRGSRSTRSRARPR